MLAGLSAALTAQVMRLGNGSHPSRKSQYRPPVGAAKGKRQNCFEEIFAAMTIKDFKVGQIAYILEDGHQGAFGTATEIEVTKVGRRYVTVRDTGRETRFFEPVNSTTYLVEDKDYGAKRLLFLTAEAVAEHKELIDLQGWVQEATSWLKIKGYTLAQLREVKKILEGGENT